MDSLFDHSFGEAKASIMFCIVCRIFRIEAGNLYPAVFSLQEFLLAKIDRHVSHSSGSGEKEQQIAATNSAAAGARRDHFSNLRLLIRVARQVDPFAGK